jgi:hypothetical protein
MIYGYTSKLVNDQYGLYQMREINLQFPPGELRRIASFLNAVAEAIENNTMRSDHWHMATFDRTWTSDVPNTDIIVSHPTPAPPLVWNGQ